MDHSFYGYRVIIDQNGLLLTMRYVLPLSFLLILSGTLPLASAAAASKVSKISTAQAAGDALSRALSAGRLQEANNLYRDQLARDPQRADMHLAYAKFLTMCGQNDAAIQEYERSLEIQPKQPQALTALADISLQALDLSNAIKYSEAALHLDANARPAGIIYANACMQTGRTGQAESELALLMSQSKSSDVLHLAYQIKARKGDFRQARAYLQAAVAAQPGQTEWMLELCKLLENSGDYETSRHYLLSALDRQPDSVEARVALARNLEVFENDYDRAISEYERVLRIDPDSPKALAGIDRCRAKKNDLALRLRLALQAMFNSHH
jgi:tetratricopeptide (TPR) repeat protein